MTVDELKNLKRGDIISHVSGGHALIVTGNYGNRVTAVRTVDVTNPIEWDVRFKADYSKAPEQD